MPGLRWTRYEFATPYRDEDGRLFLDVPDPVKVESRSDDGRVQVASGDTLWTIAWRAYRSLLDPEQDVRPSGFWWVIAEANGIVDPTDDLVPGTWLVVPSVEALVGEILTGPRVV